MSDRSTHRVLAVALAAAALLSLAPAAVAAEPTVGLRWALGAIEPEAQEPSAIKRDTALDSGSKLKFLVEPTSAGSVYLLLLDSSDEMHVLYRQTVTDVSDPAYIPPGGQWFQVDDSPGMETFFLLASAEPLAELESLLDRHDAADAGARAAIVPEIVGEIRRVTKAHRDFARPVEKPVMIGGQTRGGPADATTAIDRLAVEIEAERFYGKTITIDH